MNKYVTDTMAIILRLEKRKLPGKVKEIFKKAENNQCEIVIPAIVFAEIAYLSERGRIDTNLEEVGSYLKKHRTISECSLNLKTITIAFDIDDIPELHDKLISASAMQHNLKIITNDPDIQKSKYVKAIWK
ncbi:MAG: type II toxin-antitoxin system VapC family toxin [Chlorobi bacterium]|nr:type II toxin-antitoxin system VapC family toxin [Chlorobiota bacterium]